MRPLRSLWGTGRAELVGLSYVIDTGSCGSPRDYLQVSPHLPIPKSKQTTIQHFNGSEALQFVLGARQRVVQARHPSAVFYRLRKKPSSETARAASIDPGGQRVWRHPPPGRVAVVGSNKKKEKERTPFRLVARTRPFEERACLRQLDELVEVSAYRTIDCRSR